MNFFDKLSKEFNIILNEHQKKAVEHINGPALVLANKRFISRRYRNRRIGEFFKELKLTEGRSTGIPKILSAMRKKWVA